MISTAAQYRAVSVKTAAPLYRAQSMYGGGSLHISPIHSVRKVLSHLGNYQYWLNKWIKWFVQSLKRSSNGPIHDCGSTRSLAEVVSHYT